EARKHVVQPDDPAVRRIESQLTLQKNELESLRKQLRPSAEAYLRERISPVVDPTQRQRNIDRLQKQKKALEEDLQNLTKLAGEPNGGGLNLDDIRDDRELESKIATYLAEQREKLTVDLDAPPRVRLLEPATIEHIEEVPRKLKFAGLAALAALAVTLLGVSFLEFRLHRVDSPETVVQTLGMNLVGTVPAYPLRRGQLANGDEKADYWQHVLT